MGFPKDYAKAMKNKFGYQVVWPPNTLLEIGDYGTVSGSKNLGGAFTKLGNIKDKFGIDPEIDRGAVSTVETLQSEGVTIADVTGSGSGVVDGVKIDVEVKVSFEKKNSMVYHGSDVTPLSVRHLGDLGEKLAKLLKAGDWQKDWLVVTDVHETNGLTVLLSQSSNTSLTMAGGAGFGPGNLAKASANVPITNNNSAIANYMSPGRTTPLIRARAVKKAGISLRNLAAGDLMLNTGDIKALSDDHELEVVDFEYCDLDNISGD